MGSRGGGGAGLTLNTTWLTSGGRPHGWHVTLHRLDPDFVARSGELPAEWAGEARRSLERIRSLLTEEADEPGPAADHRGAAGLRVRARRARLPVR